MDMGETLRMAREQQGLSLEVISERTKIGTEKLRAIEENDIQRLPSGIFLRGFLRAYAREVGLDVEDTVNRYLAQFESQAAIVEDDTLYAPAEETPVEISETQQLEESLREMSMWGVVAIVVLSLGLLAYMTLRSPRASSSPTVARAEMPAVAPPSAFANLVPTAPLPPDDAVAPLPQDDAVLPPPPSESASAVPPPAPESTTTLPPQPTPVTALTRSVPEETGTAGVQEPAVVQSSNTIELTIETVGPCWVEAIVDGQTVIYAMMQQGERQRIERGNDVVLRVGDPAAFTYSINGVPGKPIGQPGMASTVHITTDNYQEFIAAPTP
jgi:cytoskeleton protein RodZ